MNEGTFLSVARFYGASVLTTRSAVSMACCHRTLEGLGIFFGSRMGASLGVWGEMKGVIIGN